jgi:hypothetical protein
MKKQIKFPDNSVLLMVITVIITIVCANGEQKKDTIQIGKEYDYFQYSMITFNIQKRTARPMRRSCLKTGIQETIHPSGLPSSLRLYVAVVRLTGMSMPLYFTLTVT